jgi:hypothetical protein
VLQDRRAASSAAILLSGGKMPDQSEQDLKRILQGAFAGPPTPLKKIPTRHGKTRKLERKPQRRRQRKNRAA